MNKFPPFPRLKALRKVALFSSVTLRFLQDVHLGGASTSGNPEHVVSEALFGGRMSINISLKSAFDTTCLPASGTPEHVVSEALFGERMSINIPPKSASDTTCLAASANPEHVVSEVYSLNSNII